jgi:hypothetical protein
MRRALKGLEAQRLAGLFVAGWLLLDFPLLRLWEGGSVFGLPRLPVALFVLWALLIVVLAVLMERGGDDDAMANNPLADPPPGSGRP